MIVAKSTPVIMHEITDPEDNAWFHAQMERFGKNSDWLQTNVPHVYASHRGKCICVAGQELFVGDTAADAIAFARQAHPHDDGLLIRYIPRERMERIYAYIGVLGSR